jgi:hypothetical protein
MFIFFIIKIYKADLSVIISYIKLRVYNYFIILGAVVAVIVW